MRTSESAKEALRKREEDRLTREANELGAQIADLSARRNAMIRRLRRLRDDRFVDAKVEGDAP